MFYIFRFSTSVFLTLLMPLAANSTLAPSISSSPTQDTQTVKFIERGGTVDSYDLVKRVLIVDGAKFSLPYYPVRINIPATLKMNDKPFELKPKMQIRFTTAKQNSTNQNEVKEIWVTTLASPIFKK